MQKNNLLILLLITLIFFGSCEQNYNNKIANCNQNKTVSKQSNDTIEIEWQGPDTNLIPNNEFGEAVRYGKKLILNTAYYIGPQGVVSVTDII